MMKKMKTKDKNDGCHASGMMKKEKGMTKPQMMKCMQKMMKMGGHEDDDE